MDADMTDPERLRLTLSRPSTSAAAPILRGDPLRSGEDLFDMRHEAADWTY